MDCTHYVPIASLLGLQNQPSGGLPFPVLVSPLSRLGKDISAQTIWSQSSLQTLLDEILAPDLAKVFAQDQQESKLDFFTTTKLRKIVRNRVNIPLQNRGPAWNCLEVEDNLSGFKGPLPLKSGGNLLDWQLKNSDISDRGRFDFSTLSGAKRVDQWLLVSEANFGSTAHVDVGVVTWNFFSVC